MTPQRLPEDNRKLRDVRGVLRQVNDRSDGARGHGGGWDGCGGGEGFCGVHWWHPVDNIERPSNTNINFKKRYIRLFLSMNSVWMELLQLLSNVRKSFRTRTLSRNAAQSHEFQNCTTFVRKIGFQQQNSKLSTFYTKFVFQAFPCLIAIRVCPNLWREMYFIC